MNTLTVELKLTEEELIEAVRRLPPQRRAELIEKLRVLQESKWRSTPAKRLYEMTGLVSLGGDAVVDADMVYDDGSY